MSNASNDGVVIVTGASQGVGRATVRALVEDHGATVLAIARNGAQLEELANVLHAGPGAMELLELDITQDDASRRIVEALGPRPIRALVHNAGALLKAPLGATTPKALEDLFRVNVFAPLLLTQALADRMLGGGGGHVVHIGSMGGYQDSAKFPGLAAYSASKAALACLAQCLAVELSAKGVRSNCLALGAADTDMLRAAFPGYQAPVSAADMGRFVARFALEGHNWFNGRVLPVALSTP
ncbi:MAG: SDR family oxidoreductase [Flavobacteriales bacterium]|nr:SDR family oxidoreductase [Flavobacteriales bacterium]